MLAEEIQEKMGAEVKKYYKVFQEEDPWLVQPTAFYSSISGTYPFCVRGHLTSPKIPAPPLTTSDQPLSPVAHPNNPPIHLSNTNFFPTCFNSNSCCHLRLLSENISD